MATVETRVAAEGQLRIAYVASGVNATAAGGAFATASATLTALLAFCEEARLDFVPPEYTWVRNRGVLDHAKRINDGGPYTVEFRMAAVNTASLFAISSTAAGKSIPAFHLEYRMQTPEHSILAGSGLYCQFHHAIERGRSVDEGDPTMIRFRAECWSATWMTGSGILG